MLGGLCEQTLLQVHWTGYKIRPHDRAFLFQLAALAPIELVQVMRRSYLIARATRHLRRNHGTPSITSGARTWSAPPKRIGGNEASVPGVASTLHHDAGPGPHKTSGQSRPPLFSRR